MIKIKGEGTSLDWQIINSIKDVSAKNIEFKNITFECQTITDASGNLFEKREKGKWIGVGQRQKDGYVWMKCSKCGNEDIDSPTTRTNFCPNCGADMRGDQDVNANA